MNGRPIPPILRVSGVLIVTINGDLVTHLRQFVGRRRNAVRQHAARLAFLLHEELHLSADHTPLQDLDGNLALDEAPGWTISGTGTGASTD